jgi:hypothetical protein
MSKFACFIAWDEVPHLSAEDKASMAAAYLPHEREARTKGVPSLGAGAIYPVPEDDILVDPFEFPAWYRHCYALDVGWNRTAALWFAHSDEDNTTYVYAEYYRGQAEPPVHAAGVKARGDWVPGVIDPAARGRSQRDGEALFDQYKGLGLVLVPANNAREAGIYEVWSRLSQGRLKVFRTCQNFLNEYRIYRRDDKGAVVKENDHLVDCLRYGVMSGIALATVRPFNQWAGRPGMPQLGKKTPMESEYDPYAAVRQAAGVKSGPPTVPVSTENWTPGKSMGQRF